jgi:transposase
MREETFTMTQQDLTKLRVIDLVISASITVKEAAEYLDLSERQVFRLKKGVKNDGPAFIIHKNRGRKPAHAISDDLKEQIVKLKGEEDYAGANFIHFQQLIEKHESINVSYATVYRALSQAGIASPKKKRKKKNHHRRKRKEQAGLLVQVDASSHNWFGDSITSLHGAIDDATGRVCALHFEKTECLIGYFEMAEQMLNREGIPISIYNDRHTIFKSPKANDVSLEQQLEGEFVNLTQFGRAMEELGIIVKFAKSAPAKGRIERLWETLQSRLPVELALRGITTIEGSNAFLIEYIDEFNKLFEVEPENAQSAFRPLDDINLDTILCIKEQRVASDGNGFSYGGSYYQLTDGKTSVSVPRKAKITVLNSHKQEIRAQHNGVVYQTKLLEERPRKKAVEKSKENPTAQQPTRPADDHPWRMPKEKRPKLFYDESDREVLDALFDSSRAWGGTTIDNIIPR